MPAAGPVRSSLVRPVATFVVGALCAVQPAAAGAQQASPPLARSFEPKTATSTTRNARPASPKPISGKPANVRSSAKSTTAQPPSANAPALKPPTDKKPGSKAPALETAKPQGDAPPNGAAAPVARPKLPPLPPIDAATPPPMLPRASRERMRACAEEWDETKRNAKAPLPLWREFATRCLTR
jgi:hypothetical protein